MATQLEEEEEEEEGEDYMSDAFINYEQDVKPGLVKVEKVKKNHEKKLEQEKTLTRVNHEEERRDSMLQCSLGSENRGFALLQKMGYKEGRGLGRNGTGIVEPIPLQIKKGRGGIGHERAKKRKAEERMEHRKQMLQVKKQAEKVAFNEYRVRFRFKKDQSQMESDLRKSQFACQQLDQKKGIDIPEKIWYWLPTDHEEEDQDELDVKKFETTEEKLQAVTDYLRKTYFYCIWCAISYEGEEDMSNNCPGNCAADHC
ncbi:G patch domain-containing protein 11 [Pristis pectinata]|uniref:G patch domain-containing protein 11 n=1 Tax=Pristis pectinata TaxID=685728 RepID=UPI00223C9D91|nr:G patch domain-containing protein 11 [Pristis pectinata]